MQSLIGKKIDQTQGFLEDGRRVPLTVVVVASNVTTQIKTVEKEGYNAVQLGFGNAKRVNKPMAGHIKKAGLEEKSPRFFREVRVEDVPSETVGNEVVVAEIFEPGDIVDVSGTSKGKGFAGVVKKWNFAGGPRTHGQSDRERARGSSGAGTTPGRVYKGKKMAGRMGNENVTVKNLEVLSVEEDKLVIKGLIPGVRGGIVMITKVGKNKKYTPLFSDKKDEVEEVVEVISEEPQEEVVVAAESTVEDVKEEVEAENSTEEVVEPQEETTTEEKAAEPEDVVEEQKPSDEVDEEEKENAK